MKRLLITTILLIFLLTACIPSSVEISNQNTTPIVEEQTKNLADSSSNKKTISTTSLNMNNSSPTVIPEALKKGKSKDTTVQATSTNPDFIATEITGSPTDTSIIVNVVPAIPMEIYYEYGMTSGIYSNKTSPQTAVASSPLVTLISGLKPNTRYYYRIRYGSSEGQERTFMTQRIPGSTFTFDIQGDSHPERVNQQFNSELYKRTMLGAASDQPDFYMTIGDDFSVDQMKEVTAETVNALYINQRQFLGQVGSPVFLVNGNHEQASAANIDGTSNNVAVWAQNARNAYFPQPAPDGFYSGDVEPVEFIGQLRDYYAFSWGDALFVVIDPYWHSSQTVDNQFGAGRDQKAKRDLWNNTLGDVQYEWLKQTLETSTAQYKFVFTHHVLGTGRGGIELAKSFEWGDSANLAARRPGWDETIHQLMVDNHVTIFFQGHDHIFVRQELDGVIYQTLPEPANPNYSWENTDAYRTGDKFPNSGRVRVSVAPDGVTVDYIRSYLDKSDELAFSYTVN
jgi:hypothetical protein